MRIFQLITKTSGGATVTAEWGPDFGESADDNTFTVRTAMPVLDDVEADYDPITAQAALAVTDVEADLGLASPSGQGRITEVVYDGTDIRGADSAVNDGPDDWTSPANAIGARGAAGEASRVGQALAATDANLRLGYANFTGGIETMTIQAVELRFDTRQTGTVLNNGGLHHEYRLAAGAWTTLEVFTGDIDNDPKTYDITAAVGGDWSKLNALEVRVRAVLAIGTNLVSCFCDAVEPRVVATKTVTP